MAREMGRGKQLTLIYVGVANSRHNGVAIKAYPYAPAYEPERGSKTLYLCKTEK